MYHFLKINHFLTNPLQGETNDEDQFWNTLPLPVTDNSNVLNRQNQTESILKDAEPSSLLPTSVVVPKSGGFTTNMLNQSELRVYSRRKPLQAIDTLVPRQNQSANPREDQGTTSNSLDSIKTNTLFIIDSSSQTEQLDIPIALRKGTKTCTKHPISKFLSYAKLSPTYQAFT